MSRSYNKNAPAWGTNKRPSDKYFKQLWHKKARRKGKSLLNKGEEVCVISKNSVSNLYDSSRDCSPHRVNKKDFKVYLEHEFQSDVRNGYIELTDSNKKKRLSEKYNNRK